jgi:Ca-activated chloride channel family protein
MRSPSRSRSYSITAVIVAATLTTLGAAPPASDVIVRGVVRSDGGPPIASAVVSSTTHPTVRAQTDSSGRYVLRLPSGRGRQTTITARRIGFTAVSRTILLNSDTVVADFTLPTAVMMLEGLVVTTGASTKAAMSRMRAERSVGGIVARDLANTSKMASRQDDPGNTEEYSSIAENTFADVRLHPRSTFSIDVDRASYSNVRRFVMTEHRLPPIDAVRIEELINYFPYTYGEPKGSDPVAVHTEVTSAPWNSQHHLVRIGLQTRRVPLANLPPNNLVFLIDVSGSMNDPVKLPLVQRSLRLLVNELRPIDRVAIVVYAGAAGLVLPSTPASDRERILAAIEQLQAGGSTAGGAGIRLAYEVAKQHHQPEGNNRIILATDGDFNVGVSSTSELVRLVEEKRAQGTFLTILGFGMGNLKDGRLEQLADKGNGNYAYVDDLMEARKVLVQELGGTLVTVAKDVKLQVEFNPRLVSGYRLIGYENRLLRDEDFDDDAKDAGEMGAGHAVTALYEVIPIGSPTADSIRRASPLRYQQQRGATSAARRDELLFVSLRYKLPTSAASRLMRHTVADRRQRASTEMTFAAAVAGYGMLLRGSKHARSMSLEGVRELAQSSLGSDPDGYRKGFIQLIDETIRIKSAVARRD